MGRQRGRQLATRSLFLSGAAWVLVGTVLLCAALCVAQSDVLSAVSSDDAMPVGVTHSLEPLRRPRHRLLLGDAAPAPDATAGESPLHDIMEMGLFDQKCSLMHRALLAGPVLVPAADNLQPDPVACCQSCLANGACTAWVYCPVEGGCTADHSLMLATAEAAANSTRAPARAAAAALMPAAAELAAPHRGCRLLSLPAFTLRKDSPQIVAKGVDVHFISGTPVTIFLPTLPGYTVRPGTDTASGLGYKCAESLLLHSCMLQGQVEELAAACDADPECKAFVYLPNGVDSLSEPIGIFKGGSEIKFIPISALAPNPGTALYIKKSVQTTTTSGGGGEGESYAGGGGGGGCSGSGPGVLWIVLPTLVAAALVLLAAVAVYATVVTRHKVRPQVADATGAAPQGQAAGGKPALAAGATAAAAAGAAAPGIYPASLTARLPARPSPPGSGGSSSSSEALRGGGSTCGSGGGVLCPQCGATFGISSPQQRHQRRPGAPAAGAAAAAAAAPAMQPLQHAGDNV